MNAIAEIGIDRVMFSADYPFEDIGEAAAWFDAIAMDEADRRKVGRENALRLFGLPGAE
jgi:gamma-resorcylate decarboxylase